MTTQLVMTGATSKARSSRAKSRDAGPSCSAPRGSASLDFARDERLRVKLAICVLLGLAACGPANRSLDTQHAPVVSFTETSYELRSTGDVIDAEQTRSFISYLRTLGLGYGDRVTLTGATPVQRQRITAVVRAFGASVDAGQPAPAPGVIKVGIRHSSATVPGCPNWSRVSNPEAEGSAMSNYGCAARSNLAAMVADPADLLGDKGYAGADGASIAKGIKAYRDKPSTGLRDLVEAGVSTTGEKK